MTESRERKIYIKELLWKMVMHWKLGIIVGVIMAVLLGAYKYMDDYQKYQEYEKLLQSTAEELKWEDMPDKDKQVIDNAVMIYDRLMYHQHYYEKSAILKMDPTAVDKVILQYYVDSDYVYDYTKENEKDYTAALVAMYCGYTNSSEFYADIIKKASLSFEVAYFKELLSVSYTVESNMVGIEIMVPVDADGEKIASAVKTLMSNYESTLQSYGSHTLKLVNDSKITVVNESIEWKIYDNRMVRSELTKQLDAAMDSMSDVQKIYYECIISGDNPEDISVSVLFSKVGIAKPGINKKYVVLGFLVGVITAFAGIVLKDIFAAKVQYPEDIKQIYGVRTFGVICQSDKDKKPFILDRKLMDLKNRHKKKMTYEQQIELAVSGVALACESVSVDNVFVTGSDIEKLSNELKNGVVTALKKAGIEAKLSNNAYYDAKALNEITKAGNAVIMEQVGVSIYDEVDNQLQILKDSNVEILGAIVVK